MSTRRARWGVIIAIAVSGILPVAASASNIGSRPANPDPQNPRTQSIFIYQLQRGGHKKDALHVDNGLSEAATIEVYAVDAVMTATGDMTCRQQAEERKGASRWVKLSRSEVTIAPGGSATVDFSVDVPQSADVGEHNACMVVQRKAAAAEQTGGIQLQTRQAVRMAMVIDGAIHREVTIGSFAAGAQSAAQTYAIDLKNQGNVSADVAVKLQVKDMWGREVYHNGGEYAAIAGQTRQLRYQSQLRPFWGGKYTVTASIAYNKQAGTWGVSRQAAELVTKNAQPVELFFWPTLPAWGIIIGAPMLAAGLGWWLVQRRRKRRVSLR